MEIKYKCNNCNNSFTEEIMKNGKFICPKCKKSDFEKIECKKYMNNCFE